ncbi:MAG: DUF1573 domain-containing protein [Armatimonas sp.]
MGSFARQALYVAIPLALVVGGLAVRKLLTRPSGPALLATPTAFSLGNVAEGRKVSASVTLRNTGTTPLEITRVDKSCDCTDLSLPGPLAPGQSAPLALTVDTTAQRRGPINKAIVLHVKGWPKNPITLPIQGSIYDELTITPKTLNLGMLTCRQKHPVSLTLNRLDGKPLTVTKIEPPAGLAITPKSTAPNTVALSGTFTAPEVPGEFQETVTLHTDDSALPTITARLDFTVKAAYTLTPKFAHFGLTREKAPKEIRVKISGPPTPLKLLSVPPSISARLEGTTVIIARRPEAPKRLVTEVRLGTQNPKQPQIPVPVYSFFSK